MKRNTQLDLSLDDDLDLSLDDIDDMLDMDGQGGDDLLMLDLEELPSQVLLDRLPSESVMRRYITRIARLHKAGRLKDAPYEGVKGAMGGMDTIGKVFGFWHDKLQRDNNKTALEVAYMAGARLESGRQHVNISSPKFNEFLYGEVMQCDDHGHVLVDIGLPNPHIVKSNHKGGILTRWRLVWFNHITGKPLDASEPFCML